MIMAVTIVVSCLRCVCVSGYDGIQYIMCCAFCFIFLPLVYPILPVSLDCQFLIAPSVFSNIYKGKRGSCLGWNFVSNKLELNSKWIVSKAVYRLIINIAKQLVCIMLSIYRICSICDKHFPVLFLFMTYHRVCNQINTEGCH